jgi:hypothetical protein
MLDEKKEASKYKLVIVLCADWSRATTHGSKFMIEKIIDTTIQTIDKSQVEPKKRAKKKVESKISFNDYNLQEWQKLDTTGMAKKIETIIARVCFYPKLEKVVLQK